MLEMTIIIIIATLMKFNLAKFGNGTLFYYVSHTDIILLIKIYYLINIV